MREVVRVYKFCNEEFGLSNLAKGRLKISTLDDLNDPYEFNGFSFSTVQSRHLWDRVRKLTFQNSGLLCFSKTWSNPVLWSHYADSHKGMALGFDVPTDLLLAITYTKHRPTIPNLSELPAAKHSKLIQSALVHKYKHWEYENEVRAFVKADEVCPKTNLYFMQFGRNLVLREVILGPRSSLTSAVVREQSECANVKVVTSRLAFKNYKVVKQRNPRLQR
ncbi:DUF2971 domain-containing protein [Sulfitobacter sp. 1A12157]|uniref:DUF2971 domain-containing protein n=1 Tax=Sulfitobacter sp. 1A12157 TaxID=3368594 RepID=UPI003747323A